MRNSLRWQLTFTMWGLFCLVGCPASALAKEVSSSEGSFSLSSSPLVIAGSPEESQQIKNEGEASRLNPEIVEKRIASSTSFEGLTSVQAASEAKIAYPRLVEQPDGGVPQLPAGENVVGYPTENAAEISLPEGVAGLIESSSPLSIEASRGERLPLDLSLKEAGEGFQPVRPDVQVNIPKNLSNGLSLSALGVSLTPVDDKDLSLSLSEGALDGSTIFWNASDNSPAGIHDMSILGKPSPNGFDLTTLLFSQRSPDELYFRIGMPTGAHLESAADGSVLVVEEGTILAAVRPPSAEDAEGTEVPVSMGIIQGNVVTVTVNHPAGEYLYPISVDPEVTDPQLSNTTGGKKSNWEYKTINPHAFYGAAAYEHAGDENLESYGYGTIYATEWGYWGYQTKGDSKIYDFNAATAAINRTYHIESFFELEGKGGGQENKELLSTELSEADYGNKAAPPICPKKEDLGEQHCLPTAGGEGNAIHFQQTEIATTSKSTFSDWLEQGIVSLSEPSGTHSTTGYNVSPPELEFEVENEGHKEKIKRANALYGTGNWLSKYDGALELIAKDPGIGVSSSKLEYESTPGKWEQLSERNYLEKENGCEGVQCKQEEKEYWTLNPKLPNGEDKIRYRAQDAMPGTESLESEGKATVKVDTEPPHHVVLKGLPFGAELSERPYEVTGEATDGEGTTIASSGVKSIALFVDNHEVGKASGSCSVAKGECTASAKWTINGSELGAGHHTIVVVAFDNAGNEKREEGTITVRHSTPVALGPGSVDLQSGDFSIGTTDVSMGSGLTVSRNYSSRDLTAGIEGPLGSQWSLGMGSTESLVELASGNILMTAANGSQTIFTKTETTTYESPTGDSNLTLTVEEPEKHKIAYFLKDAANHTSVKFTQTSGSKLWVPTTQEGAVPTDTVTYKYQTVGTITEPTEALGPVPSGVSCSWKEKPTEMERGCRALEFKYAKETTAKGENETEWGEYNHLLTKVSLVAYSLSSKAMQEIPVAEYSYDRLGRLRAEWDPRISPALKTTYGYDEEGHVTALNPPGQEPWLFTYGTISGDSGTGRLIKFMRVQPAAGASEAEVAKTIKEQKEQNHNIEVPKITGTPSEGTRLAVSNGKWTKVSLSYGYQWEDCNASGVECKPILGATSGNYTPSNGDVGHTLVAVVTGIGGGGSVAVPSTASGVVGKSKGEEGAFTTAQPGSTIEYDVPLEGLSAPYQMGVNATTHKPEPEKWGQTAENDPVEATAILPPDSPQWWPSANYKRATIYYMDEKGQTVNVAIPSTAPYGSISTTEYNEFDDVTRTLSPDNRATALAAGEKSVEIAKLLDTESTYNGEGSKEGEVAEPGTELIETLGPQHEIKYMEGKEQKESLARSHQQFVYNQGIPKEEPYEHEKYDLVTETTSFAKLANNEDREVRTTKTSYSGQKNSGWKLRAPTSVTIEPPAPGGLKSTTSTEYNEITGQIKETRGAGAENTFTFASKFGEVGSEAEKLQGPWGIAVDSKGDVWVTDTGNDRVEEFSPEGKYMTKFGEAGSEPGKLSEPRDLAIDSKGALSR